MSTHPASKKTVSERLHEKLRAKIRGGDFAAGDQFWTEREIAARHKVSRATANKVLSQLVSEGWLEFRTGAGTFVRGDVLDYNLRQLVSFTEQANAVGKRPTTKVVVLQERTAAKTPAKIRKELVVSGTEKIIQLERLRLADDVPVIFERRWIVRRLCPKLSTTNARGSLYSFWTEKCALEISGAHETIRAVNLNTQQAKWLDVLPQTAALMVQSTGFVTGNQPLWYEETLYRTDVYEFRNRLGGLKNAGPAVGGFAK